ncbi:Protein of unknown function (DUF1640) [Mactra antiquata]
MARVLNKSQCVMRCVLNSVQQSAKVSKNIQRNVIMCRRLCQVDENSSGSRAIDPVAAKQTGIFHFDTLAVSKRLENSGFQREEAEELTQIISDVVTSVVEYQNKINVTKPQQEIMVQQLLSQIGSVKKDMVILEKSEFTMIRNDTEKQGLMIKQFETQLAEGIKKLDGQVKLDLNLEKARAVEAHALNEKQLQALVNRLDVEQAQHEKNLQNLNYKIDVEVSKLKTQNEKNRHDALKYLVGIGLSSVGVILTYYRLFH